MTHHCHSRLYFSSNNNIVTPHTPIPFPPPSLLEAHANHNSLSADVTIVMTHGTPPASALPAAAATTTTTTTTTAISTRPRLQWLRQQLLLQPKPQPLYLQLPKQQPPQQQQQQQSTSKNTTTTTHNYNQKPHHTTTHTRHHRHDDGDDDDHDSASLLEELRQFLHAPQPPPPHHIPNYLTDTFGRTHTYVRFSLTERCNLRCTYCMPETGVPLQPKTHLLTTPEWLRLASVLTSHPAAGVTKFRLTGGEPTLRRDLIDLVHGLHRIQQEQKQKQKQPIIQITQAQAAYYMIGMTSNGIALAAQLPRLVEAGLTNVNVSLDTLVPSTFAQLTRRPAAYFDRVMHTLEVAHALTVASSSSSSLESQSSSSSSSSPSNHRPFRVKINCVIMRGINDHEVPDFIDLVQHRFPAFQVRFIEYMPFDANGWNLTQLVPYQELIHAFHQQQQNQPQQLIPVPSNDPHDTTKWFGLEPSLSTALSVQPPQPQRKVGFITSMSAHFCDACNRLRVTADGQLKVCLFGAEPPQHSNPPKKKNNHNHNHPPHNHYGGGVVVSVRDAMRHGWTDDELLKLMHWAVQKKHKAWGGHTSPEHIWTQAKHNRPMTLIGG